MAIVTGSTSGIGLGIAKLFGAEGAKVIVCGRRREKGQEIAKEIGEAGGEAAYIFLDLTAPESIEALFKETAEKYGKIDILINNASNVALPDGKVDEVSLEMWDQIFQTYLRGTFFMIKTFLPYVQDKGGSGTAIPVTKTVKRVYYPR